MKTDEFLNEVKKIINEDKSSQKNEEDSFEYLGSLLLKVLSKSWGTGSSRLYNGSPFRLQYNDTDPCIDYETEYGYIAISISPQKYGEKDDYLLEIRYNMNSKFPYIRTNGTYIFSPKIMRDILINIKNRLITDIDTYDGMGDEHDVIFICSLDDLTENMALYQDLLKQLKDQIEKTIFDTELEAKNSAENDIKSKKDTFNSLKTKRLQSLKGDTKDSQSLTKNDVIKKLKALPDLTEEQLTAILAAIE